MFDSQYELDFEDARETIDTLEYILRNNRNHIHFSPSASAAVTRAIQVIDGLIESRQDDWKVFYAYIAGVNQADKAVKQYINDLMDKLERYEEDEKM